MDALSFERRMYCNMTGLPGLVVFGLVLFSRVPFTTFDKYFGSIETAEFKIETYFFYLLYDIIYRNIKHTFVKVFSYCTQWAAVRII